MAKGSNDSMGGVNLNDMLILLYRINIQTRKRWYLKNYYVSRQNQRHKRMATSYKIYMKQLAVPKKK